MYNLPRRADEVRYEPEDAEGVVFTLDTMTRRRQGELAASQKISVGDLQKAQEAQEAIERGEDPGELDFQVTFPADKLVELFDEHVKGGEGFLVGGEEEFDPDNDDHLEAVFFEWKVGAARELMQEAQLSDEEGKGSAPPDDE